MVTQKGVENFQRYDFMKDLDIDRCVKTILKKAMTDRSLKEE